MAWFEKGAGYKGSLHSFWRDQNFANVVNGIVDGVVFGLISVPLIMKAAETANISQALLESWMLAIYLGGGIVSVIMSLYYRLPIVGAWSIPGAVALAQVLSNFTPAEIVGGFIVAGLIDLFLGVTGLVRTVIRKIPIEVMMGMVGGALLGWGSKCVVSFVSAPIICASGVIAYLVFKRFFKKIPPVVGTVIGVMLASLVLGKLSPVPLDFSVTKPVLTMPVFNLRAALSIGLPLALLIVCAENMMAIGVQVQIGKKPPVNAITIISGIGGIIAPFFFGHNVNIAGPMTAWAGSDDCGPVDKRYVAAVWCGIAFATTGIWAKFYLGWLNAMPMEALNIVVSLTLISMIIDALKQSFGSGKFQLGSFASFITAAFGASFFGIGSACWALIVGTIIAIFLYKEDYDAIVSEV